MWMKTRICRTSAAVLLVSVAAWGCDPVVSCTDNECVGGLHWIATTADELPLVAGEYTLELELEDNRFTIACSVAEDGAAQCDEAVQISGDRNFQVDVQWFGEHTTNIDGMGTTLTRHGIDVSTREHVDLGVRGPTHVGLTLDRDGEILLEEAYAPMYERDPNYHGDERCGFCDSAESRESTWSQ